MPSIFQASIVHAAHYLNVAELADEYYSADQATEAGISLLDQNREQIDAAVGWLMRQDSTNDIDILVSRFSDALLSMGMIRYSVTEMLVPLQRRAISAAQHLGRKELEASSFDGLGILYAFLGYLKQAVLIFEAACEITGQVDNKHLKMKIQSHLKLAQKQLRKDKPIPVIQGLRIIRLVPLQLRLLLAKIRRNPFIQIASLNQIGGLYLDLENWRRSTQCFQRAISLSQKHGYRFGELDASMGLLQSELACNHGEVAVLREIQISSLVNDIGFQWVTDYFVFETLLEIAPAIKSAETIATSLARVNDPRAEKLFQMLDRIMTSTTEIVLAATQNSDLKHKIFVETLSQIKDDLSVIVKLSSEAYRI